MEESQILIERLFSKGKIREACELLLKRKAQPPTDKIPEILAFGDKALEEREYFTSLIAYCVVFRQDKDRNLSETAKKKIIDLGDSCFKNLLLMHQIALDAFWIVRDRERLIRLGDKCLEEGGAGTAFGAYKAANAKEKLIELGKKLEENPSLTLPYSWAVQSKDAFEAAAQIEDAE